MVATSPPAATTSSTSTNPQRPPVRNKSSSALSAQTARTVSSTSSGKPRRNRSFTGLAGGAGGHHHGHPAGHHAVSFAHHHRKNSHGAHTMKRSGSTSSGSARKSSFGLGMTSMERGAVGEDEQGERDGRPQRPALATSRSSSSSTVTAVGGGSRERLEREASDRGRSRSRSRARVEAEQVQQDQADQQRQRLEINTKAKAKERLTGSVTSTSDWESAIDSPLAIGKKLPNVAKSVAPEGQSALAQAFSQQEDGEDALDEREHAVEESPKSGEGRVTAQDEERAPAPQRVEVSAAPPEEQGLPPRPTGKKPKFQLGASEDQEDDESPRAEADGASTPRQEKGQAEADAQATQEAVQAVTPPIEGIQPEHIAQAQLAQTDEDVVPDSGGDDSIPPSAMPPAATAILPSLPAMIQAAAPSEPLDAPLPLRPDADEEQQAAALAPPAPPTAPQHLSPPDSSPLGGPAAEPSLAAAAQPELAFPNGPPSGPPSRPDSAGRTRGGSAEPLRTPAPPTPTSEEEEAHLPAEAQEKDRKEKAKDASRPQDDASPIRPLPQRALPTRKASNTSIVSAASTRSALHRGPAPQFRRTASGIAPVLVDRDATARAELTSPGPESPNGGSGAELRRSVTGERGSRPGRHERTESMSSIRSLRQAAEATTGGSNRQGPGEMRRLRPTETAGGAIAALGNIAAAAGRTPPPEASNAREGALTHAKRSASGYFNALRGFTTFPSTSSPSTPPLSSSAGAAQRYPIPGAQGQGAASARGAIGRSRSSDSPKPPPLVVKFVDAPPHPPPMQLSRSQQGSETPSTQPSTSPSQTQGGVPPRLSAKHRNASTTSLGPMSRTQQKALLARDAPHSGRGGAGTPTMSEGQGGATLAPPPVPGAAQGMTPAQQQFLALQQQRAANAAASASASTSASGSASTSSSPAPGGSSSAASASHGMQKWAIGLVREAERIERQYRAVEKWRDPVGESLERVLVVRMRARRRREDDRERVRRAVEGLQAQQQTQGQVDAQPKPRRAATTST